MNSLRGARHFNIVFDDQALLVNAGRILVFTLSESLVLEKLLENSSKKVPLMSVPPNQTTLFDPATSKVIRLLQEGETLKASSSGPQP